MMVLASVYLSVSASLPSTQSIKPVEIWLLFNLAYPFLVIIANIIKQVQSHIVQITDYVDFSLLPSTSRHGVKIWMAGWQMMSW